MPINLKNKDLSKFSPRAIDCLKWWLQNNTEACPFTSNGYDEDYACENFCHKVFDRVKKQSENTNSRSHPCSLHTIQYITDTVRAIIAAREAEWKQ